MKLSPNLHRTMTYSHTQTKEDKEDAKRLQSLLNPGTSNKHAEKVLKETFSELIRWTLEDIQDHLTEVFKFTPIQVDYIIDKYSQYIPTHRDSMNLPAPLPVFKRNTEQPKKLAENYWNAKKLLKEAKKLLSQPIIYPENYSNDIDFELAKTERTNINSAFVDIDKFINIQIENAHQYIQGGG
jgi:hypothetical protein